MVRSIALSVLCCSCRAAPLQATGSTTDAATTSAGQSSAAPTATSEAATSDTSGGAPTRPPFELPEGCGDGVVVAGQYDCLIPIDIDELGAYPLDVAASDADGDGREELVVRRDADTRLMWHDDDDGVVLGPELVEDGIGSGAQYDWRWDWNGDGRRDLSVLTYDHTSGIAVHTNLGARELSASAWVHQWTWTMDPPPTDGRGVAIDVDGDGQLEVVSSRRVDDLGRSNPPNEIVLRRQTGEAWEVVGDAFPFGGCGWLDNYAFGDFDGDGDEDLAISDAGTGCDPFPLEYDPSWYRVGVFLVDSSLDRLELGGWFPTGGIPGSQLWVSDGDDDGQLDVIVNVTPAGGERAAGILRGRGDGTLDDGIPVPSPPPLPEKYSLVLRADIDGDGQVEWLAQAPGPEDTSQPWILAGTLAEPTPTQLVTIEAPEEGWSHSVQGAGDINGDGVDDLVVAITNLGLGNAASGRYVLLSAP